MGDDLVGDITEGAFNVSKHYYIRYSGLRWYLKMQNLQVEIRTLIFYAFPRAKQFLKQFLALSLECYGCNFFSHFPITVTVAKNQAGEFQSLIV